ncbi:MAG: hypothetical protein EOO04_02585 [Chitinophagaceae bacterium]|nr:MAG: hypothetical protein EOO04_02585 [Chitinophagaceae bacterium]
MSKSKSVETRQPGSHTVAAEQPLHEATHVAPESTIAGATPPAESSDPFHNFRGVRGYTDAIPVRLTTPGSLRESDLKGIWEAIACSRVNWEDYKVFIDGIMQVFDTEIGKASLLFNTQAYNVIKYATEEFVRVHLSSIPDTGRLPIPPSTAPGVLPYYEQVLTQLNAFRYPADESLHSSFRPRLQGNRVELIWSYWMEEGMLVQSMNAIALRFQNISVTRNDALANLEMDSLRPLSNVLFGYIQDTHNRLTISRRNHEYMYEYGIRLFGDAVPATNSVSVRTNFIETFHSLLYQCILFYKQIDDLTKNADAYPLFNTLQEVNLLLMQGMHNQYNDLSLKARSEMMLEQWILSRPEIQEYLRGKPMVIYDEPWMSAVDTMKDLQGWPGQSIRAYHELAVYGEELLLTIRLADWNRIHATSDDAKLWAVINREAIQRYIHNYKSVTGVDIAEPPTSGRAELKGIMPGILINQRTSRQRLLKRG